MNLKKQSPLAWEDFEKWYNKNFPIIGFDYANGHCNIPFIELPFEMQLGVLLKYLDEKEITVLIMNDGSKHEWFYKIINFNDGVILDDSAVPEGRYITTMGYCQKEAMEQAFKIRNEQLKKLNS